MTKLRNRWLVLDGWWLLAVLLLAVLWLPPSTTSVYERGDESFELTAGLFHWLSIGYERSGDGVKAWFWQIAPKSFLGTLFLSALAVWILVWRRKFQPILQTNPEV